MVQFCGQCGSSLTPGNQFCGQCGTRIPDAPPATDPVKTISESAAPKGNSTVRTRNVLVAGAIVVAALVGAVGLLPFFGPKSPEVKVCEAWFEFPTPGSLELSSEDYFTWLEEQTAPAVGTPVGRAFTEYIQEEQSQDFFFNLSQQGDELAAVLWEIHVENSEALQEDLISRCDAVLLSQ